MVFSKLLQSRTFWLALAGLIQTLALTYLQIPEVVWQSINDLLIAVIAAYTAEDIVLRIKTGQTQSDIDLEPQSVE